MAKPVVSERVRLTQILALGGYGVSCFFCLLLLLYLRMNRHVAFKGDAQAARKVILPAFEPLLWIFAATTGAFASFFCVTLQTSIYTTHFPSFHGEVIYAGRQFVLVLALVFLCQKSVSVPALRRAVVISLFLACYTIPIVCCLSHFVSQDTALYFAIRTVVRLLLLIFVINVCFIHPPACRASPSTLRVYGSYTIAFHTLNTSNTLLRNFAPTSSIFATTTYVMISCGSLAPFFVWTLLRADTEYWRGVGQRACALQQIGCQQGAYGQNPQLDEWISSNGIHLLIELHRKVVIDFAHLELFRQIGVGSSATVFRGQLQQQCQVAVKVYTPYRFTEEVVAEFSHEAALCASLLHPNIVKFYGMCVCPPTICLVFELCQGSLEDVLTAHDKVQSHHSLAPRRQLDLDGKLQEVDILDSRQILLKVAYMLDCARAVAYVHSFSPPFLHRDIKPANFLVDNDNNVKLTDFGDSRRLAENVPKPGKGIDANKMDTVETSTGTTDTCSLDIRAQAPPQIKMTVTGTVNYMAPEMIDGRTGLASYGESADVYSLGITFWDILYPGCEKYGATNPMVVFEGVLNGWRPPFDDTDPATSDEAFPAKLRDVITSAWQSDPMARPSMPQIVHKLEGIQEELLAVFAQDLSDEVERSSTEDHVSKTQMCITGDQLVERMKDLTVIDSRSEGVRLGRALMGAGFLHHLDHERGFLDSKDVYFFDDGNIDFCQPLAMLEKGTGGTESNDESSSVSADQDEFQRKSNRSRLFSQLASTFSPHNSSGTFSRGAEAVTTETCACRSRGQRLHVPMDITNDRQNVRSRQHHRLWRRNPRRLQTRNQVGSSSNRGNRSHGSSLLSAKRWRRKMKLENMKSLMHKLLDGEQDHTIDVVEE
uniref:Protein kinase domain-containing protein n=1 Tax=Peronospora matthiolae TaxID=2874970 RepID=A0AAV1VDC3_9STRA